MSKDKKTSNHTSPSLMGEHPIYKTPAGDTVRVVSVFCGNKTASELIHKAVVRKILYDCQTQTICE